MPIMIINHFYSLICILLQYLQSVTMEESQPIHSATILHDSATTEARKDKENLYQSSDKSEHEKPQCLLGHLSKKYRTVFAGLIFFLLALIIFEECFDNYVLRLREYNFNHNLNTLKEYQQWKKQNSQQKINEQAKLNEEMVDQTFQQVINVVQSQVPPNLIKIKSNPTIDKLEAMQFESQSPMIEGQSQPTVNNPFIPIDNFKFTPLTNIQFDFQSDLLNQPVISTKIDEVPYVEKQPQQQEITVTPIKFDDSNNDVIDYANYTGVNIAQVANALDWMQLKYYPITQTNQVSDSQREYYEQKYWIGKYEELPICVVVPSFNNAVSNRHINNMNSILMQDYTNYHIVFIDDASTDSTATDILQLLTKQVKVSPKQYVVIRNEKQMMAMNNLRTAANIYCKPQEIFIVVDGDDELIGRQVFKLFNANFQQSGAWFVYSNFLTVNDYVGFSRMIPPKIIEKNGYRTYPFVTSHLRAFYTQLFRNIKEEDLKNSEGQYLTAANDVAICFPILQQAQDRIFYIPQLTYSYNSQTGFNNHLLRFFEQKANEGLIRSRKSYVRLKQLFG